MSSLKELKAILDAGGNPNELLGGMSYIHLFINENDGKMINYIIEKGANPNTPNCTAFPHPLIYAIKLKKNLAVRALLSNGVNPNLKSPTGTPVLITAVNSNNTEAVKLLLDYEADPNATNARDEIALFHAINKGDIESCRALLDYQSRIVVGNKSALHFAIKQNQPECVRLLLEHDANKNEPDANGIMPIDIASELDDPTIELLLYTREVPQSTENMAFIKQLYENFEVTEIEEVRDIMLESPARIPLDIHGFIDRIMIAERCHQRFRVFLKMRIENLTETIEKLSHPSKEILDKDIDKLSKQLRNSFIKRIDDSTQHQKIFEDTLMAASTIGRFNQWKDYSKDMLSFIDSVIADGLLKFGVKDEYVKKLDRSKKDIVKVKEVYDIVLGKTSQFQQEIADFISATIKKLKEIQADGIPLIEKHLKMLIRQIEVTNPELVCARFKKDPNQEEQKQ